MRRDGKRFLSFRHFHPIRLFLFIASYRRLFFSLFLLFFVSSSLYFFFFSASLCFFFSSSRTCDRTRSNMTSQTGLPAWMEMSPRVVVPSSGAIITL
jgi:hypothetical protein